MAAKYLRSSAAGTGTGADWTNAYTTITAALAGMAAGDTLYVADDHAESTAGAITLTSPGTSGNPIKVICVNTHVTTPPVGTATSATISTTGLNNINFANGYAYVYGITFTAGNSTNAANIQIGNLNNVNAGWLFDTCVLALGGNATTNYILFGVDVASFFTVGVTILLHNTQVSFSNASQTIRLYEGFIQWRNTTSAILGTVPTNLFNIVAQRANGRYIFTGLDLSALGSGKNIFNVGSASAIGEAFVRNCKLGASVTTFTGTIQTTSGLDIYIENCDSGNTNYKMEHYKYQGSIKQETTIVKSSGATDGTTPLSHKFVSLSTGPVLFSPLVGPWLLLWNETTGSSVTVTVEFLHDSATNLKNDDIYLEVEYLGTSGYPQSIYSISRVADVFATASDCPSGVGTGSWTTTGMANPNSQKVSVTFTPQQKGLIRARVCLCKSNYTVYVDPVINTGSGTGRRTYLIPQGGYLDELADSGGGGTTINIFPCFD